MAPDKAHKEISLHLLCQAQTANQLTATAAPTSVTHTDIPTAEAKAQAGRMSGVLPLHGWMPPSAEDAAERMIRNPVSSETRAAK